jgi:hypothetical protein
VPVPALPGKISCSFSSSATGLQHAASIIEETLANKFRARRPGARPVLMASLLQFLNSNSPGWPPYSDWRLRSFPLGHSRRMWIFRQMISSGSDFVKMIPKP